MGCEMAAAAGRGPAAGDVGRCSAAAVENRVSSPQSGNRRNPRPATRKTQPATRSPRPAARKPQPAALELP